MPDTIFSLLKYVNFVLPLVVPKRWWSSEYPSGSGVRAFLQWVLQYTEEESPASSFVRHMFDNFATMFRKSKLIKGVIPNSAPLDEVFQFLLPFYIRFEFRVVIKGIEPFVRFFDNTIPYYVMYFAELLTHLIDYEKPLLVVVDKSDKKLIEELNQYPEKCVSADHYSSYQIVPYNEDVGDLLSLSSGEGVILFVIVNKFYPNLETNPHAKFCGINIRLRKRKKKFGNISLYL